MTVAMLPGGLRRQWLNMKVEDGCCCVKEVAETLLLLCVVGARGSEWRRHGGSAPTKVLHWWFMRSPFTAYSCRLLVVLRRHGERCSIGVHGGCFVSLHLVIAGFAFSGRDEAARGV